MISGLLASFLPYIIAGGALLIGVFGYGVKQKRAGKAAADAKRREEDLENARKIQDELDAVMDAGGRDALDRLREQGRLRD